MPTMHQKIEGWFRFDPIYGDDEIHSVGDGWLLVLDLARDAVARPGLGWTNVRTGPVEMSPQERLWGECKMLAEAMRKVIEEDGDAEYLANMLQVVVLDFARREQEQRDAAESVNVTPRGGDHA